ncbi:MAG: hypothetical protein KAI43_10265 [Candidatus Aureabacteria bacterium]|nr:hypothetical protein [Candidatus Auribacterota bacterium]
MSTIDLLVKDIKENPNVLNNNELYNKYNLYKLDSCNIICYNILYMNKDEYEGLRYMKPKGA